MKKIGYSHGVLYRVFSSKYNKKYFKSFEGVDNNLIEICVAEIKELDEINNAVAFVKKYNRKSIHLPCDIRYKNNEETRKVLENIFDFYNKINANLALVHPDLIDDWSIFDNYNLNWAIENMDNRKDSYKNIEDLKDFFEKNDTWKMVLDLNHCYSNDKSMQLADNFINEFKNKIEEIHLSGYIEYHEPLYKTKQNTIIEYCKKLDVPIIIESTFDSVDEVKKEIKYIKDILNNK